MPFDQKSRPPSRQMICVGRDRAWRKAFRKSAALLRAHGAVVEVECQIADLAVFPVVNVAVGPMIRRALYREIQIRHVPQLSAENLGGWQLEARVAVARRPDSDWVSHMAPSTVPTHTAP